MWLGRLLPVVVRLSWSNVPVERARMNKCCVNSILNTKCFLLPSNDKDSNCNNNWDLLLKSIKEAQKVPLIVPIFHWWPARHQFVGHSSQSASIDWLPLRQLMWRRLSLPQIYLYSHSGKVDRTLTQCRSQWIKHNKAYDKSQTTTWVHQMENNNHNKILPETLPCCLRNTPCCLFMFVGQVH